MIHLKDNETNVHAERKTSRFWFIFIFNAFIEHLVILNSDDSNPMAKANLKTFGKVFLYKLTRKCLQEI